MNHNGSRAGPAARGRRGRCRRRRRQVPDLRRRRWRLRPRPRLRTSRSARQRVRRSRCCAASSSRPMRCGPHSPARRTAGSPPSRRPSISAAPRCWWSWACPRSRSAPAISRISCCCAPWRPAGNPVILSTGMATIDGGGCRRCSHSRRRRPTAGAAALPVCIPGSTARDEPPRHPSPARPLRRGGRVQRPHDRDGRPDRRRSPGSRHHREAPDPGPRPAWAGSRRLHGTTRASLRWLRR